MEFEIDNLTLLNPKVPTAVIKIIKFLDELPDGKMLTSRTMVLNVGYSNEKSVVHFFKNPNLEKYRYKLRYNFTLWGNPKTIEEYKEYVERQKN